MKCDPDPGMDITGSMNENKLIKRGKTHIYPGNEKTAMKGKAGKELVVHRKYMQAKSRGYVQSKRIRMETA